jgi:hypothetical protein
LVNLTQALKAFWFVSCSLYLFPGTSGIRFFLCSFSGQQFFQYPHFGCCAVGVIKSNSSVQNSTNFDIEDWLL